MNRSLFRFAAYLQIAIALLATGCAPTQPFFLNEGPSLQHYLDRATAIEYPDVDVESLAETTEALPPLSLTNQNFEYWDLTLEECVSIALNNAKFLTTVGGTAEERQNIAAQFAGGTADQFGSIYDVAIQQSTTQTVPLAVDQTGNRLPARGALRANQIGGVEDALAEFDAQLSGFISYGNTDRPRNVGPGNIFNPQLFRSWDTTQQLALSKRTATGGVATLRQQVIYNRNNIEAPTVARAFPSDFTAILEAQVQHPLMRGRGALINRIPVVLASLNEDTQLADFELQVRNLVRDVEVAYWDLYTTYRNLDAAKNGRDTSQATARFAELRLQAGAGAIQEVAQAQEQYFQFRGLLNAALAGANLPGADRLGVFGAEVRLRELMGLAATDGRLIRPIDEPSVARVEFDWDEARIQALFLSPELRRTKVRVKQRELELMAAKNQLLPQLDASLLYRWVGVGDTLGLGSRGDERFPDPGSSALGELTSGDFQEAAVRLEFTPPAFGARRELTRVRGSQLQLVREKAFLQEQERLLVSQLTDAIRKLGGHYAQVQDQAQRWAVATQEVEARLAEYRGGVGDVNVVLQSQQRRALAEIDYHRSLAEYNKSISYVHYLKGTLLEMNNITLDEGPWPKKAYFDALERARERSAGRHLEGGYVRPGPVRRGEMFPEDAAAMIPLGKGESVIYDGPMLESLPHGSGVIEWDEPRMPPVPRIAPPANGSPGEPVPRPRPDAAAQHQGTQPHTIDPGRTGQAEPRSVLQAVHAEPAEPLAAPPAQAIPANPYRN